MEHRLLLIETSATQRYVDSNFLEDAGFGVRNAENYQLALELLEQQFTDPEHAADCVLLSWPVAPDENMQAVLQALEGPDFSKGRISRVLVLGLREPWLLSLPKYRHQVLSGSRRAKLLKS